jgi:hypothetical protein
MNMADHVKSCYSASGRQTVMTTFVKRVPGNKRQPLRKLKRDLSLRLGYPAVVDNPCFRSFAQLMIQTGSKYGSIAVEDVLYGRQTVRDAVFESTLECQKEIKKLVVISSKYKAVAF